MYIGPLYINTKELFLILTIILLGLALRFGWSVYWFDLKTLLFIVIALLIIKSLIPTIQNEAFFLLTIITVFLSLYLSWFQIMVFFLVFFAFSRWMKLI